MSRTGSLISIRSWLKNTELLRNVILGYLLRSQQTLYPKISQSLSILIFSPQFLSVFNILYIIYFTYLIYCLSSSLGIYIYKISTINIKSMKTGILNLSTTLSPVPRTGTGTQQVLNKNICRLAGWVDRTLKPQLKDHHYLKLPGTFGYSSSPLLPHTYLLLSYCTSLFVYCSELKTILKSRASLFHLYILRSESLVLDMWFFIE